MGRNETNLDKLNRLATQRYEDSREGLLQFSNDFSNLRSQLECLNALAKDKFEFKSFIDYLLDNEKITKEEYQKLFALMNGIEVA